MQNESNKTKPVEEPIVKTSKLKKIKSAVIVGGFYGITIGGTVASTYISYKIMKMNYETAKLKLEEAKNDVDK